MENFEINFRDKFCMWNCTPWYQSNLLSFFVFVHVLDEVKLQRVGSQASLTRRRPLLPTQVTSHGREQARGRSKRSYQNVA